MKQRNESGTWAVVARIGLADSPHRRHEVQKRRGFDSKILSRCFHAFAIKLIVHIRFLMQRIYSDVAILIFDAYYQVLCMSV